MPAAAWEMAAALEGVSGVSTDPEVLAAYRSDQAAPGMLQPGEPAMVVRPRSTAEVQVAVRAAVGLGMSIVPRGAGSGLSGGANASDGCMILSLEQMNDLVELDQVGLVARVQAGLVNARLKEAAAAAGLFYAPDPASFEFSTLGGNVATNAGGLCCVKYGVTRDAVLGLEVVLADGRAVRIGGRSRKDVGGYDLVSLFCGSEGTLGIVTEITMRLLPQPRPALTMAASFQDLPAAGRAIVEIVGKVTPSLLEIMDATTIGAVEAMQPMDLDDSIAALVFARVDVGGTSGAEDLASMVTIVEEAGAGLVVTSDEEAEGRMLMAARRLAYPALERLGATLLDDVGVPVSRLVELFEGVPPIAARHDLTIGIFGHAGDGNMHPTIVYPHGDPDAAVRARAAFRQIVKLALSLGGTISGEHGVGVLKRDLLGPALGNANDLNRAVKQAFDAANILNPGKAI